jgi:hypothetical protein
MTETLRGFLGAYWDTDVRLIGPAADARADIRLLGIEQAVRRFLADAILRESVSPEEWSQLFNVQTYTRDDVRRDAVEFWRWLYDGAPLPSEAGRSGGALSPPQS